MMVEDKFDGVLAQHLGGDARAVANDHDAAARVLAALAAPLPPQRRSWRHWPTALLNWDFAPAWPRLAALAGCAALGFAVGVAGPSLRGSDTSQAMRGDFQLAAVLSEPEPMTGVQP